MDCDLYWKNNEHEELKTFPLSLLVLKYFLYVSDMKKESTELKKPRNTQMPYTHTHACAPDIVGCPAGTAQRMGEWGEITKREIKVPLLAGLLLDTPKPGSLVNWIRVLHFGSGPQQGLCLPPKPKSKFTTSTLRCPKQ